MVAFAKTTWLTILLGALLLAAGILVYLWSEKSGELVKQTELSRDLRTQIDELQKRVEALRRQEAEELAKESKKVKRQKEEELAKQIELNQNLTTQVNELKKQIEELKNLGGKIKGVSIATDKIEYKQRETITITVRNDLEESIFSHIGSGTPVFAIKHIQRKTAEGSWENLYAQCQPPHCFFDIDTPVEINPGESASFKWKPLIYVNGTRETATLNSGEYRLVVLFEDSEKTEWTLIYTNEFRII